jgi:hypothetical protein
MFRRIVLSNWFFLTIAVATPAVLVLCDLVTGILP